MLTSKQIVYSSVKTRYNLLKLDMITIQRHINYLTIQFRRTVLKIPKRTLIILICILVGISAWFSAFLLKSTLHYIHQFIQIITNKNISNLLLLILPIIGLF